MTKNYDLSIKQWEAVDNILHATELNLIPLSADLTTSEFAYEVNTIKAIVHILCNDKGFFNPENCEDICLSTLEEIKEIIEKRIEDLKGEE